MNKIKKIASIVLALTLIIGGITFSPQKNVKAGDVFNPALSPEAEHPQNANYGASGRIWKTTINDDGETNGEWSPVGNTLYIHEGTTAMLSITFNNNVMFVDPYCSLDYYSNKNKDNNVEIVKNQASLTGFTWINYNQTQTYQCASGSNIDERYTLHHGNYWMDSTYAGEFHHNEMRVYIKGLKYSGNSTSNLKIFYTAGNNSNYTRYNLYNINIKVIRPIPSPSHIGVVAHQGDNYNTNPDEINMNYININNENNEEESNGTNIDNNIYFHGQTLNTASGATIWEQGDSIEAKLDSETSTFFNLEEVLGGENGGSPEYKLSLKKEAVNYTGNLSGAIILTYKTTDASFNQLGGGAMIDLSTSINSDGFGRERDEGGKIIYEPNKWWVRKIIRINVTFDNSINAIPFYNNGKIIKNSNFYIDGKQSFVALGHANEYDQLTTGEGWTIDKVELSPEAQKMVWYTKGSFHGGNNTYTTFDSNGHSYEDTIFKNGEHIFERQPLGERGVAYNGLIVTVKKSGSTAKYVFNIIVSQLEESGIGRKCTAIDENGEKKFKIGCYGLQNSEMNIINNLQNKQQIKLYGLTNFNDLFNNNPTLSEIVYNPEDIKYQVVDNTIVSVTDGLITPKKTGTTKIKVSLPAQAITSAYSNYYVGPLDSQGRAQRLFVNSSGEYKLAYEDFNKDNQGWTIVEEIPLSCEITVKVNSLTEDLIWEKESVYNNYYKLTVGDETNFSNSIATEPSDETVSRNFAWKLTEGYDVLSLNTSTGNVKAKRIGIAKIKVMATDGSAAEAEREIYVTAKYPQNIKIIDLPDGIKVSWKKDNLVSKYKIYRSETIDGEYEEICETGALSYLDEDVSYGKTYYYTMTTISKDEELESNESPVITHKRSVATPILKSVDKEGNRAKITISGDKYNGYVLYYGTSKNPTTAQATFSTKTAEISLPKHGTYYFRVKAYATQEDKNYYSDYSNQIKFNYSSNTTTSTTLNGTVKAKVKKNNLIIRINNKKLRITTTVGKKIKLKSSKKKVLKITKKGKLIPKKSGKTIISFKYNGKKYKIKIKVKKLKKKFKIIAKFKGTKYITYIKK